MGSGWSRRRYFVCAKSSAGGPSVEPKAPVYKEGSFFGGTYPQQYSSRNESVGTVTAYDMSEAKIVWQTKFPGEARYSGTVTTAGGLVFVGRSNGELEAVDEETGKSLWHFQTGAGANTTVTAFEDEGEEKIAIYAGGNSLAATPHGDNFWVFSLKGEKEELFGLEEQAEGKAHVGEEEKPKGEGKEGSAAAATPALAEAGKEVFAENCSSCHGATGHGGNGRCPRPQNRRAPKNR